MTDSGGRAVAMGSTSLGGCSSVHTVLPVLVAIRAVTLRILIAQTTRVEFPRRDEHDRSLRAAAWVPSER
jgi:hypothetical protein